MSAAARQLRSTGIDAAAVGLGQIVAFAYPIVSLPLLARVFGADSLGHLIVIFAVLQLLVRFTDYGFSVSAVRRIAIAESATERSEIVSATLGATAMLWLTGASVVLTVIFIIPATREQFWFYALGVLLIGSGCLGFPEWLLQGLRKLKLFSLIKAVSRVLALVGLLITVRAKDDMAWAVAWQFAPMTIAGLLIWPVLARRTVSLSTPAPRESWATIVEGRHPFYTAIAQAAIGSLPSMVLGTVSAPAQVAYYGSAERFGNAGRGILFATTDAMLPRMTDAAARPGTTELRQRRMIMSGLFGLFALGGTVLAVAAGWFVPWYLGDGFGGVVPVARVIGLSLVITGGVGVLALALNAEREYKTTATAMILGAAAHAVLLVPLAMTFGATGAAWALALGEAFMLVLLVKAFLRGRASLRYRGDLRPQRRYGSSIVDADERVIK